MYFGQKFQRFAFVKIKRDLSANRENGDLFRAEYPQNERTLGACADDIFKRNNAETAQYQALSVIKIFLRYFKFNKKSSEKII